MSDPLEPCPYCGSNLVFWQENQAVCNHCGARGPEDDFDDEMGWQFIAAMIRKLKEPKP